ncbi:hypothetical protein CPC08DRAFT_748957 [Agrocybe pediades]|nr:hypothetical protein CPC08DRAFT_748957 [Agrocybe pediades]
MASRYLKPIINLWLSDRWDGISRYQPTAHLGQGDCVNISAAYSDYLSSPENGVTADEVANVQKMKEVHRKQARPGERLGLVPICLTLVAMNFRSWAYGHGRM